MEGADGTDGETGNDRVAGLDRPAAAHGSAEHREPGDGRAGEALAWITKTAQTVR